MVDCIFMIYKGSEPTTLFLQNHNLWESEEKYLFTLVSNNHSTPKCITKFSVKNVIVYIPLSNNNLSKMHLWVINTLQGQHINQLSFNRPQILRK